MALLAGMRSESDRYMIRWRSADGAGGESGEGVTLIGASNRLSPDN